MQESNFDDFVKTIVDITYKVGNKSFFVGITASLLQNHIKLEFNLSQHISI